MSAEAWLRQQCCSTVSVAEGTQDTSSVNKPKCWTNSALITLLVNCILSKLTISQITKKMCQKLYGIYRIVSGEIFKVPTGIYSRTINAYNVQIRNKIIHCYICKYSLILQPLCLVWYFSCVNSLIVYVY